MSSSLTSNEVCVLFIYACPFPEFRPKTFWEIDEFPVHTAHRVSADLSCYPLVSIILFISLSLVLFALAT